MPYRVKRFVSSAGLWDDATTADEKLESFLNDSQNKIEEIASIFSVKESIVLVYKEGE